jgi:hypothetical protein
MTRGDLDERLAQALAAMLVREIRRTTTSVQERVTRPDGQTYVRSLYRYVPTAETTLMGCQEGSAADGVPPSPAAV